MPKQSKAKRARQAQRQANAPTTSPVGAATEAPQAQTSTAPAAPQQRFVNTAPPLTARPSPTVKASAKARPEIKVGPELRRIAIVTGVIVVILIVLAVVLNR